jgi:putative ABC transport system ATP-binding protein
LAEPAAREMETSFAAASRLEARVAARLDSAVRVYTAGEHAAVRALDGVTLALHAHRFTAVIGPSGSGKSTLLQCLAGLDRLTSGRAFIGDIELGALDDTRLTLLRRERVGMIFQSYNLVPGFDVAENIVLPLVIARRPRDHEWFEHIVTVLGLRERLRHQPAELSGGEQQRVAAGRALMTRPDLIIADEPTGNLDTRSGAELLDILRRAVGEMEQTVVMVTHDARAAALADRVVALVDGGLAGELTSPTLDDVIDLANAAAERAALRRAGR